jgi:hypothetical protein
MPVGISALHALHRIPSFVSLAAHFDHSVDLAGRGTGRSVGRAQAAFSHIAVSKALLISGMFVPKLLFAALFAAGFAGFSATADVTSVARSQEPSSCERATEKNRST